MRARILAAAPELLDVVEMFAALDHAQTGMRSITEDQLLQVYIKARAVLAKVQGYR